MSDKKDTRELHAAMVQDCISQVRHNDECLIRAVGGTYLIAKIDQTEAGIKMEAPYNIDEIAEQAKDCFIGGLAMKMEFIDGQFGEKDLETATGFGPDDKFTKTYIEVLYRYPRMLIERECIQIGEARSTGTSGSGPHPIMYDLSGKHITNDGAVNLSWRQTKAFDTLNEIDLPEYSKFGRNPDNNYIGFYNHQMKKRNEVIKRCEENEKKEEQRKAQIIEEYKQSLKAKGAARVKVSYVSGWGTRTRSRNR